MSQKEEKGLKSFNKGFQVPDTYIIIFLVVVIAALLTFLVPKGFYETQDISYMINGVEKTRTVIKDGSFQYLTDDAGNVVTEGVALFSGDGGTGFFNYMYNGIVNSSAIEIIAFLMVVGGAFGIMIRTGEMCIRDRGKIEWVIDRKLSAVFQEDRLCENLSAASNIRLVCTETITTHPDVLPSVLKMPVFYQYLSALLR